MTKACEKKSQKKRVKKSLSLIERKSSFAPVERGLTEEEAVSEASRCLGVRECESCDLCSLFCPDLCITRHEETAEILIDLEYCKGCGICAAVCPKGAIKMVLEEGA
jgi:2-oxoacid:acceptor oxidoreductase delta subunit (pyruvate/2-ketoisovalerate family)